MERFTTDTPQGNTSSALNLFYIKDGETWVRGGGSAPDYLDVRLYDYIREVVETLKADIDDGLSDDDLGECLYELLADGNSTMEGITATLYMAAWAFSSLHAKLAAYEDTGLEPEEMPTGLDLANVYAAMILLKQYEGIGTVDGLRSLKEAEQKRRAGCVRCESPCQTCMIGCFKQEPDTCGGYTLPPMQYFCKTCGRDLRGESHE